MDGDDVTEIGERPRHRRPDATRPTGDQDAT
jgi:hypothetical protein